jgi:hypothetical protein
VIISVRKVLLTVSITKLLKLIFSSFINVLNVENTDSSMNVEKDDAIGPKNDNWLPNIELLNILTLLRDEANVERVILEMMF